MTRLRVRSNAVTYGPIRKYRHYCLSMGRDSSVGIATRYGLDGPGIESRWGARFSSPVQTGPGAHPTSCKMGSGSFPGVKRPGRGADHPPPSKCRGWRKSRAVHLLPLWAFVACSKENFIFTFTFSTVCPKIHAFPPQILKCILMLSCALLDPAGGLVLFRFSETSFYMFFA